MGIRIRLEDTFVFNKARRLFLFSFTAEIIDGNLLFNRTEIEAISAEVLTKADLITLHRRYILNPSSSKALITLIESGSERSGDGQVETVRYDGSRTTFDTIEDYKKTLALIEW